MSPLLHEIIYRHPRAKVATHPSIHSLVRSTSSSVPSLARPASIPRSPPTRPARRSRASAALFANDRSTCTTAVGTTRARHSSNTASCTSRRTSIPANRVSSYSASDAARSIESAARVSPRDVDVSIDTRERCILPRAARENATSRDHRARRPRLPRRRSTPSFASVARARNVDRCLASIITVVIIAFDKDHHRIASHRVASHLPHPSARTPRPRPRPPPSIVRARRPCARAPASRSRASSKP